MPMSSISNISVGAPFSWPQGTFNPDGKIREQARVTESPEITWRINSIGENGSVSVKSNSGHSAMIQISGASRIIFDDEKKAFTLSNPLAGILLFRDHARLIDVTNAPSIHGGRIYVANLSDGETFGRICTSKGLSDSELAALIQLAKKSAEMAKGSVAVHTPVGPYHYPPASKFSFTADGEFISRDKNHSINQVISVDEIMAIEVC